MNASVADTHALFWYLVRSPRLGQRAKQVFADADQGRALIYVPTIVLAELYYLNVKQREPLDFAVTLQNLNAAGQFVLLPLLPHETLDLDVDRAVPEMHDRIIVGVARRLGAPVLTRDAQIVASGLVPTIW